MFKQQAKQRIEKLKKVINHHRFLYHVLDKQEISIEALDSLKKELFDLEQKFPEFITFDSPTQRVGGKPLKKFEKIKHSFPMLSFNDAFSEKDLKDWLERISKLLSSEEIKQIDFFCELKIDGLAIELIYQNNILKIGSTRGDGLIGEDVIQNLKTIESIPLKLRRLGLCKALVVRGEVFISKKEFQKLNKEQFKKGLILFANPRNIAAGSIRQLDQKITASRGLDFFAYDLLTQAFVKQKRSVEKDVKRSLSTFFEKINTHQEKHQVLKILGFKISPYSKYCRDLNEVFAFYQYCQRLREKIPYEIDGIVVIVNSNKIFEKLGVVGKTARGSIAFKFPLKQATTIIKDIKAQVGRTGAITPVALLKPVEIGGTIITRATLHNEDELKKLGVKIGDTVIVGRAGDVIPDVIRVLPELRIGKEEEFIFPKTCPSCLTKLKRSLEEVILRCENSNCFARQKKYFYYFVSRSAFDIDGLGPKIIDKLIDTGLISDPADLFRLKEGDLISLENFAEKSAQNLIEAIQARKKIAFFRFIYALGIRNVGEETARDLAEHFETLQNLKKADSEGLEKITDIGLKTAESISNWFQQKNNVEFLEKLKKAGVEINEKPIRWLIEKDKKLEGKTFVLTGSLEIITREEAKEKIRLLGGKVSESVSKKTDYLVEGREPGFNKIKKTKKLGVKIIKEQEFLKIIK